jgi:integron integrase
MIVSLSVQKHETDSPTPNPEQTDTPKPRLLDQVRDTIRRKHYSIRTEQSYIDWIKRFIYFHNKQHPRDLSESHITEFLNFLAVQKKVASSTQNQALCAMVFLYREVIKKDLSQFVDLVHAKRPSRLPVVFTPDEIRTILLQLDGVTWIMGQLLYGAGLRVMECVRLRVKDVDFGYRQITVRDGKGQKDRVTMLPEIVIESLSRHLEKVKKSHEIDLQTGFGTVYLPYALERKYPNANRSWNWQYVFPASRRSIDPRSGVEQRHHISESVLQRAIKKAIRAGNITKPGSCHSLRHFRNALAGSRL